MFIYTLEKTLEINNLHFTETLKGSTYRLKRCEYILNALKFSC